MCRTAEGGFPRTSVDMQPASPRRRFGDDATGTKHLEPGGAQADRLHGIGGVAAYWLLERLYAAFALG